MSWETVIGLEIHVQLSTKSKLFSGGSTEFGAEANTHVDLIDMGLPGVLPVANKEAFYKAIRFGLATKAKINQTSSFDRKNYFYPDLPKGYQITQMTKPIVEKGSIKIYLDGSEKVINITRAHLEEDAGKSIHDLFDGETGVDLNRAGTPLLEIVSEPEISNAKEAVAYFKAIRQLVTFLDICDGNMAEGSMRCDVNVSIKKNDSSELGTRAELKNINSFKFIEKAINFEIDRQTKLLENGESVVQETRLYDSEKNETRSMRSKEEANDYRYFPCPDLLPVVISDKELIEIKENLPELPEEKEKRYVEDIGLDKSEAVIISSSKAMANMFEEASAKTNNTISGKIAKSVLEDIWENGSDVDKVIETKGLVQIQDESILEDIAQKVIQSNPDQVSAYLNGKDKLFGFFVGQIMKETQGKANPKSVNDILRRLLK
jgi:aspartyl-tRNA(Asn)/glutamyl-tRNA(Gln) amidotransferase subunit B